MSQEPRPTQEPQQPQQPQQWKVDRDEKEEKDEKDRGQKWENDSLSGIAWGGAFIWTGLVFLADKFGWLPTIYVDGNAVPFWSIILIGAGLIFFLEALLRLAIPAYRRPVTGTLIWAGVLVAFGLGAATDRWTDVFLPIIFIAIGLSIILGAFINRR